ncbi:MAG: TetR/AcrR family transcriptional regulator [Gammaproteobacteria bacterium]|nr:MAG: TetR/AcrR family transcriptional regulator [Gammaproteobacteria bacterium]
MSSAKKQPDVTRQTLLEAAFHEIHRNGFRAASLEAILKKTGVTKGALYYHFPNKKALGYAVLDELIGPTHYNKWKVMFEADDPIAEGIQMIDGHLENIDENDLVCGCPLNNLAQEMSPVDEGFRERVNYIMRRWQDMVAAGLERGQEKGHVRRDVEPQKAALFLIASAQGCIGLAKNAQSIGVYRDCVSGLKDYLKSLRPAPHLHVAKSRR